MKKFLVPAAICAGMLLSGFKSSAQIVINEVCPSNINTIMSSFGEYDDWIEIYNAGSSPVNLENYGLSDIQSEPWQFRFPDYEIQPGEKLVIFASDTNSTQLVDHWESAVKSSHTWRYRTGSVSLDTNWRNLSYNHNSWSSGTGGFGFGDGDDNTSVSQSRSIMLRKTFTIPDTADIARACFHIDYDDGFVAFLNGVEIARANLGVPGDRPAWNILTPQDHEAVMYDGGKPDSFFVDVGLLKSIIRPGNNVLAVQVHNETTTSNDLSAIPFLSFGMLSSGSTFSSLPSWFDEPDKDYFYANFKLGRTGETIYLTDPNGIVVDQITYPSMESDDSYGRKPDGSSSFCIFGTPTPDHSNNSSSCYAGYTPIPLFSLAAGFYNTDQWLTLTTTQPGGVIHYTTNGNTPTTSSPVYWAPILLDRTTTVRAMVESPGNLNSPVITNTYFIDEDITLPVFTISTDSSNLWDWNTGIYVMGPNAGTNTPFQGANFWMNWEKPASIEYYDRNKSRIFKFDSDIKIYGNYSRAKPQKSFEIKLSDKYGMGELTYPLYTDKPKVDKVDNFILRNAGTDWNIVHFRDAFMERVMKPTHSGYIAGEPCVGFLNGKFWGVYIITENHDQHWMKNNFGYKREEIDYMKEDGSTITVKAGTDAGFWEVYNYAVTQNQSTSQFYNYMNNAWDLDNYMDYFIAETYYNNGDWIGDWTNNIKFWRPKDGKFRYLLYDTDFGLGYGGSYTENRLAKAISPAAFSYSSNLFNAMLANPTFKRKFINRYADLINTIYKPSAMVSIMHQFQDTMEYDMPEHFAKWGGTMNDWEDNIDDMVEFINRRPERARDHIESVFALDDQVTLTLNVNPAGAGRIQISTVVPSSYPWSGVYFEGNPVTITAIPNPGYEFHRFRSNNVITSNDYNQSTTYDFDANDVITAYFNGSASPALLTVSELNYNSDDQVDAGDWIELHNYGTFDLDISGWKIHDESDDNSFEFPVNTVIPANGYLVIAEDLTKFSSQFPSVSNVTGPLGFNLSNAGEQVRVRDHTGQIYLSFYYQDMSPWPDAADGQGYTCELATPGSDLNDGANWFAGCIGGSPGTSYNGVLPTTTIVSGSTTFCVGGSVVLSTHHTPGYSYQWQQNHIDIPGATDTIYTGTQGGVYTVSVSYLGCTSVSNDINVTVVTQGIDPVVTSAYRCGQGSVTLNATAPDSIYWFDAPGGNVVGSGPSFTTPSLSTSTTYYAQTSLTCPSNQVAVTADVYEIAAPPVINDETRCGPGSVTLITSDTATTRWYNAASGGALLHTGDLFITGIIQFDTTFYVQSGDVCPSARTPVNVIINATPAPTTTSASRCGNGSVTLTASSPDPVIWYDALFNGTQVGTGSSFNTPSLSATTVYYAEANNGCPSPRVAANAIINTIPDPPVASDESRCGDGTLTLNASSSVQVFWYDLPTGGTSIGSGSTLVTPVLTSSTTFYAASEDLCNSLTRTPVQAIVIPASTPPVTVNGGNCGPGSVTLSATATDSITWYLMPGGGTVLASGGTYVTPPLNSTTTYYAVAGYNCPSMAVPAVAQIYTVPSISLGADTTIDDGELLVLNPGNYASYAWSDGSTSQTLTVSEPGDYFVTVTDGNGCTASDTISVSVITGIADFEDGGSRFGVYPNPASGKATITFISRRNETSVVEITDPAGRRLYRDEVHFTTGRNRHEVDLSGFAAGVYYIRVINPDYLKTMPVTVK